MANISRNSFVESKGYDKVILQQGSPITDYDFNEAQDIQRTKLRRIIKEVFGDGAVGDSFLVTQNTSPNLTVLIKPGIVYVAGYRVMLNSQASVTVPAAPTSGTRKDIVYVEVTEQEIDSIMDPEIKHTKLTVEPTRRIKISVNFRVGTTVPADTEMVKYYKLAEITRATNDNTVNNSEIVDVRSVLPSFEGAGFSIKGSSVLGSKETDQIDMHGAIRNTSSNFGGYVYVDDNMRVTKDLLVNGKITQTGVLTEVARIPIFGVGGDIQYQSDARTWEDVSDTLYALFSSTYAMPTIPAGATRKYKLLIAYSDTAGGASVRLITGSTAVVTESLPAVNGSMDGSRRYMLSKEFSAANNTDNYKLQAMVTTGEMNISYVELIAYDVY